MGRKKKKRVVVKKIEIKEPGSMRLLLGGLLAYWLSGIINPAFIVIAVMILLFFPVFFVEFLYPEPESKPVGEQPAAKNAEAAADEDFEQVDRSGEAMVVAEQQVA